MEARAPSCESRPEPPAADGGGSTVVLAPCADAKHLDALAEIASFAYRQSSFYRRKYDKAKVKPDHARLPDDLPIVRAEELVRQPLEFRTNVPIYRVVAGSGTTSTPKLMFRSKADFELSIGNELRLQKWAGVEAHDVVAVAQAYDLWASGELIQAAAARIGATVVPLGLIPDADSLPILVSTGVTVLDTTPSRLERMLRLSSTAGPASRPAIRTVMVSGEPLAPRLRETAEAVWQADIFDQYGTEETDGLAGNRQPCGALSLLSDDFVFELLDPVYEKDGDGVVGRLLVSSLYHKGTPLVRYLLDDLVRVHPSRSGEITVLGRASECFFLYDSVKLHPHQVQAAFDAEGMGDLQWKCFADRSDTGIDRLELLFAPDPTTRAPKVADVVSVLEACTYEVTGLVSMGDLVVGARRVPDLADLTRRGKNRRFVDRRTSSAEE